MLGDAEVERLREQFGFVQDLCVYWFRRAADQMQPGSRAGFVGTNSISQNRARGASLNYVVERGGVITDAISKHTWPGEAVVNVSIVNWTQEPDIAPTGFVLDGRDVEGISTRLRESKVTVEEYARLPENVGRAFQGAIPAGDFYLSPEQAAALLSASDADYSTVVRPYLVGDDITDDPGQEPRRWVIDFGFMALEEAMRYPAAVDYVRTHVKPDRDRNRDRGFREQWWRFGRPRGEMRRAIGPLDRYIAGNAQGKRFLFTWQPARVVASNLTNVFAFDDDYSMGILTSVVHQTWARSESSTLRIDLRYTPTTCFEPFPWPSPTPGQRARIGDLAKQLIDTRQNITRREGIGLTMLYNQVDDGAYEEVTSLHRKLDQAVLDAYGYPRDAGGDHLELKARLAALHAELYSGETLE